MCHETYQNPPVFRQWVLQNVTNNKDELLKAGSINLTQREVLVTLGHQYQVTAGLFLTLAHLAEVRK